MKLRLLLLFLLPAACAMAQPAGSPAYPQDYFRNPLNIPIFLAGNFGECRAGHFHSGADIKTLGKENQPVHAAAAGYISRIKMDKGGFGHALYITHPNGFTTLYAHLNNFAPAIQQYLRRMQYEKKKWDLDISLGPSTFPVKKGQQIAWSGNTGGSAAPHLHFEIRDSKTEHPLNPQLFGLPITDKLPPVAAEVVFYNGNIYEDGGTTVTLAKKGQVYKPTKTDIKTYKVTADTVQLPEGLTGIAINADDYITGSTNTITFYTAKLYTDDSLQAQVTMDDIGYDESRYINAYTHYPTRQLKRKWMQCLFLLPGNRLTSIFSNMNSNKGRIMLIAGTPRKIKIVLEDNSGNTSDIEFYVNPVPGTTPVRQGDCTPFFAGKPNSYSTPNVSLMLDEKQLYDDICFTYSTTPEANGFSDRYTLHTPNVPLHHYTDLMLKPNRPIPFALRSKVIIRYTDGKDDDGRAATSNTEGWYMAAIRNFGTYWLDADTVAPVIKSLQKDGSILAKATQLAFEAKDAATSVKTFSGYLDGKWICFEQHGSRYFYTFDEHCTKGKHKVVFTVADECGNDNTATLQFTR